MSNRVAAAAAMIGLLATALISSTAAAGTFSVVYNFASLHGNTDGAHPEAGMTADGDDPSSSLVFDDAGNLYGTTPNGGANGQGVVFRLSPPAQSSGSWKLTTLYSFCSVNTPTKCADGAMEDAHPNPGVVFGGDGSLYGATPSGGDHFCVDGCGTLYRLSPPLRESNPWHLKTLYTFCVDKIGVGCGDGAGPADDLVNDGGTLYGVTNGGGDYKGGTIFTLAGKGTLTPVYDFGADKGATGVFPVAGLTVGDKGQFFGATSGGGAGAIAGNGPGGVVFRLSAGGGISVLHAFCQEAHCPDGYGPDAAVARDAVGNIFGTTRSGGAKGSNGTLYEVSAGAAHAFHLLHSFCSDTNCDDGANPTAPVIVTAHGTIYGVAFTGGIHAGGALFTYKP
jgi:uncharacterized repeat protein (TIGR03803 family)